MQIGQLIAQRRELLGMTQPELAEKCGLSQWTIYNYEKLTSCPRFDDAVKIMDVLGCRVRIEKVKE